MNKYSSAQLAFLREGYKHMSLADLTSAFNEHFNTDKSVGQIRGVTRNHKMKSGRTGHFDKGALPWNTGTKGVMTVNSGSFKKGLVPANSKPLGHERICTKDDYVLIKVAEKNPYTGAKTRYKHKHIVIWEQLHGPVPAGMVVKFADGNKRNFDPANLQIIDRNLLCRYNKSKVYSQPSELIPTMKAVVELKQAIHKRSKAL